MDMQRWIRIGFRVFLVGVVAALIGFFTVRTRYYDVIISLAQTRVTNATSDLINDAVARQIASGQIAYENVVFFEKDINGRITALKTNVAQVNMLKTETLQYVNETLLDTDEFAIGVPIGSMVFPEFLSGKGPQIPVQIVSIRNSDATFHSNFLEAGINQTLHQLKMTVMVDVTVLILGQTVDFTVTSDVVAAETVIVGEVPNTFLQAGG